MITSFLPIIFFSLKGKTKVLKNLQYIDIDIDIGDFNFRIYCKLVYNYQK